VPRGDRAKRADNPFLRNDFLFIEWVIRDVPLGEESRWVIRRITGYKPPWFALHEHGENGVVHGVLGTRPALDDFCREHGIVPEESRPVPKRKYHAAFSDLLEGHQVSFVQKYKDLLVLTK
jgi:hypothetical protein